MKTSARKAKQTEESRRQFEAWMSFKLLERYPEDNLHYSWPGIYKDANVEVAWQSWLASREKSQ